ncbi:protein INCREASED PETAL GROWTH ANISOTROPY 1 [Euphorbia lathyris]|uniref:protein INCREASED PETAL GROWTH ANISOTROPY 1 n=1 Tax=Euphorbia lathyris TaxID=212925 RepID=UPI0033139122
MSHPVTTPSRFKINSNSNSKLKIDNANGSSSPANKSVSPDVKKESKTRRSLLLSKPKSPDLPPHKSKDHMDRSASVNRVEQFSRPRRPRQVDSGARRIEEDTVTVTNKELQEKEFLIKELQSQVLSLKAELDKAHSLNKELDSHNKKLAHDLAEVAAFNTRRHQSNEQVGSLKFNDSKIELDDLRVKTSCHQPPPPPPPMRLLPKAARTETDTQSNSSLPPRPPPPPPMRPVARAVSAPKTPAIVEFYRALRKQEDKRDVQGPGNHYKSTVTSAHNSIVGEIQNRSAHLLAIKADVETKGDFINGLIKMVVALAYTDIEDVLKFVDWLDDELSTLADERAVLKHFNWPEKKADAIREAAIEYRGLKQLEREITSFKDDISIPCGTALKKMALLLDKSERGIGRLIKLRSSVLRTYQDWKIPTNWMLDSGIASKIKEGSKKLAKMYVKRVKNELEVGRNSDRECNQEALVLQGVQFAYRAHQFAGGLDSETLCAFEEIRQRVPQHHIGVGVSVASRELLAAVP